MEEDNKMTPAPDRGEEQEQSCIPAGEEPCRRLPSEQSGPDTGRPFRIFQTREEYQAALEGVLSKRLRTAYQTKERLTRLTPLVDALAEIYGTTDEEELVRQLSGKTPAAAETAEERDSQLAEELEAMKREDPVLYGEVSIDELERDPRFRELCRQGIGCREAYQALHPTEVLDRLVRRAAKQITDNIRARGERPAESAARAGYGGGVFPSVSAMDDEEIDALTERARRGERIVF